MVKNCNNCVNRTCEEIDAKDRSCATIGYPLFADCDNWGPENEAVKAEMEKEELARKLCWR